MTQRRLHQAVAAITGESLRTVRRLGFSTRTRSTLPDDHDREDLHLVLDCPFCGQAVPYPGRVGGGVNPLAECLTCDVDFDFSLDDVYAWGALSAGTKPRRGLRVAVSLIARLI